MTGTPAVVRSLPEPKLQQFAEEHSLHEFVREPLERLEFYFGVVRDLIEKFKAYHGYPPPDRTLRGTIALTLNDDGSFRAFVKNHRGSVRIVTETEEIYQAGAGAILCEYLRIECGVA